MSSYRKPVPIFVPSPPPSPPSSPPAFSYHRVSLCLESALRDSIPPLPEDWREAIQIAVAKAAEDVNEISMSNGTLSQDTEQIILEQTMANKSRPSVPRSRHSNNGNGNASFVIPRPHSNPTYFTSSTAQADAIRKTRLHHNYRPPTPPVPALTRDSRIPDDSTLMLPGRLIYPDMPSVQDLHEPYQPRFTMAHRHSYSVSSLPAKWDASVRTLLASGSSDNDTLPSYMSTCPDTEMGWVNLPPYEKESLEVASFYRDVAEPSPLSLWHRLGIWSLVFRQKVCTVVVKPHYEHGLVGF